MNIFNCQALDLSALPDTVLNGTNWVLVSENNLGNIDAQATCLKVDT